MAGPMLGRFVRQAGALTSKNLRLLRRRRALLAFEICSPAALVLLLGLLDLSFTPAIPSALATQLTHLESSGEPPVRCHVFGPIGHIMPNEWCVPISFAPHTVTAEAIMAELARRNGYRAPRLHDPHMTRQDGAAGSNRDIVGFDSVEDLNSWVRLNKGRLAIAIVFRDAARPLEIDYEIWFNRSSVDHGWYAAVGQDPVRARVRTVSGLLPDSSMLLSAQRMVDEAILSAVAGKRGAALEVRLNIYPQVPAEEPLSLTASFGSLFLTMALTLPVLGTVVRLVSEKEQHVAGAMRSLGVPSAAYWLACWSQVLAVALPSAFLVYLTGVSCGVPLIAHSDGSVCLVLFVTYLLASSAGVGFLLSSLTARTRIGTLAAVLVMLTAIAVSMIANSPSTNNAAYLWWEPGFPSALRTLLLLLVPSISLVKVLSDMTVYTSGALRFNATSGQAEYAASVSAFDWNSLFHFAPNRTASVLPTGQLVDEVPFFVPPPPAASLGWMMLSLLVSLALAWYFNEIAAYGAKPQHLLFPLDIAAYWGFAGSQSPSSLADLRTSLTARLRHAGGARACLPPSADSDVVAEVERLWATASVEDDKRDGSSTRASVQLLDLKRIFGSFSWRRGRQFWRPWSLVYHQTEVVKGLTVAFHSGEVFALLGHNGAGKTVRAPSAGPKTRI